MIEKLIYNEQKWNIFTYVQYWQIYNLSVETCQTQGLSALHQGASARKTMYCKVSPCSPSAGDSGNCTGRTASPDQWKTTGFNILDGDHDHSANIKTFLF